MPNKIEADLARKLLQSQHIAETWDVVYRLKQELAAEDVALRTSVDRSLDNLRHAQHTAERELGHLYRVSQAQ